MVGKQISHYRVVGTLGRGGMGDVYLAEDLRLQRQVALKIVRPNEDCDHEARASLLQEARAASALNHPNIAVIYAVEEVEEPAGTTHLLVMEYVSGETVTELSASRALAFDEVLDIIGQAADALAEAHAHGVVHRDVKPSNLMVTQGRVKMLDFGLAQVTRPSPSEAETLTQIGSGPNPMIAGTPHYLAPEQARGQAVDARSDLFSLGAVFYELLAGKRPFEGDSLVQVLDAVLHHSPPPFATRFTDPRSIAAERLVMRMLAKEPSARPRDAREVSAEITRLRANSAPALSGALSVAVPGFTNVAQRPEDAWLGTGLAETVTAALQAIEGLEVWGRERLREGLRRLGFEESELQTEDAVQLGRWIGARWVLSGAFQRLGEQVRVTARVVEVDSGRVIRTVREDGRLDSIFELQDRIVAELSIGLRGTVVDAQEGEETHILAAYEALSKGLLNVRTDTYEALERAILHFERALVLDPDYVRAQVELGAALRQKADYLVAPEIHDRAIAVLRRALEQRPRLARTWRELGLTLIANGRVDEGIDSLRRALALAPEDPRVLAGIGRGLFIGKADFAGAAEHLARSVERSPGAGWYWLQLAHCYALLRDFDRGMAASRRAIELQEESLSGQQGVQSVGAYMRLGHFFALRGRHAEAREEFERELAFTDRLDHALRSRIRIELHLRLGRALHAVGLEAKAKEAFATALEAFAERVALGADEPFTRYYAAATHAQIDQPADALELLDQSVREAPAYMTARARLEPEWDVLRDDPRFRRIVGS